MAEGHKVALPLHLQTLHSALSVSGLVAQLQQLLGQPSPEEEEEEELDAGLGYSRANSLMTSDARVYNFTAVTEERKWVQDLLLSSSDDAESELSESEQLQILMEVQYKRRKRWRKRMKRNPKLKRFKYLSAGLLCQKDPYPGYIARLDAQLNSVEGKEQAKRESQEQLQSMLKEKEAYRMRLWSFIAKKEVPKMAKQFNTARHNTVTNNKRLALLCQREVKKAAVRSQRASKEVSLQPRAKRLMKEALIYWRRYERVEREQRKRAEKEASEQRKLNDEMREARRQQRKLNFLITQTELYAHFMAKKLTGEQDNSASILRQLEDAPLQREVRPGVVVSLEQPDEYDSEDAKAQALANVHSALSKQSQKQGQYVELVAHSSEPASGGDLQQSFDQSFSLATPMLISEREVEQPAMFKGLLKAYQLKGMNWLANLYDQGINGILADEMGLGKTVQSIALLAHLAERQNTWGPFLVVSPASTLHNWVQEFTRFVPRIKALPYWGSPHERKIIRKYWNQKLLYKENAPFHVLITSYQLVVQDIKYFQRVKWQYMILDEAQAIKSSSSIRWRTLLSFTCRNRLLLTGTPIQNTMQELWALLHFIMPTMFDSHEEFNEWFSRDIESHAERKSALDEGQLSRLHLILKPFMLRRIKRDVEHEMAEKIEVNLTCELSTRQRRLYDGLRKRISIDDLLHSATSVRQTSKDSSTSHLLNLVMQFRKVCNHPDLFDRRDVKSPLRVSVPDVLLPRLLYQSPVDSAPRQRLLTVLLGTHTAAHMHLSSSSAGCWSFLRLTDMSPHEACQVMLGSLRERLLLGLSQLHGARLLSQQRAWDCVAPRARYRRTQLLLWPSFKTSPVCQNGWRKELVFTSHCSHSYTHADCRVSPLKSGAAASASLTEISSTVSLGDDPLPSSSSSCTGQATAPETHSQNLLFLLTDMPKFLVAYIPKVQVPWQTVYCYDRGAEWQRLELLSGGPPRLKQLLLHGKGAGQGLDALSPPHGWSHIHIPDKENMIYDSGKMVVLDKLLVKLKQEDHRVLIYSQMTRVIDLLEEFMAYRRYKYIRLDGSSRISDRRDMVDDFQNNEGIFVFLLSTRAGGLGINLTAADTVIFYDSDWNPTVDQQAMDRAHRLGQTKQVTVYRLIVKGTIEERILQRAREKSEIQKMVISGGDFKPDALKAKEMVSLLLDDDEMETRFLARQAERRQQQEQQLLAAAAAKGRKRRGGPNGKEGEPFLKKPASAAGLVSGSPSPLVFSSSRPGSVLSVASSAAVEPAPVVSEPPAAGETDGSDMSRGNGGTPVRPKRRAGTSAPLGGRGKIRKKKVGGSGSAAASAGAIAGAIAASNAAQVYGYGYSPHTISPSPSNSPGLTGSSQSSPRVSPVPFQTTPTRNKCSSSSSLAFSKNNNAN